MRGNRLPQTDTIARHCSPRKLSEDGQRPLIAAFLLNEHDHLSVNWVEFFGGCDREEQLSALRDALGKHRTVKESHKLALLRVSSIITLNYDHQWDLSVLHWPIENDPSHSGIFGFGDDPMIVSEALSNLQCELVRAK